MEFQGNPCQILQRLFLIAQLQPTVSKENISSSAVSVILFVSNFCTLIAAPNQFSGYKGIHIFFLTHEESKPCTFSKCVPYNTFWMISLIQYFSFFFFLFSLQCIRNRWQFTLSLFWFYLISLHYLSLKYSIFSVPLIYFLNIFVDVIHSCVFYIHVVVVGLGLVTHKSNLTTE